MATKQAFDGSGGKDPNKTGFGLPDSVCVGEGVGDPYAGGNGKGRPALKREPVTPSNENIRLAGGDPYAGGKSGKSRTQQATEKWIPGSKAVSDVSVGYDGP